MERKPGEDNASVLKLYEASMEGCVPTLNSLIQEDPLILSKISLTTFGETPLHIAALLGHLNFTRQLLSHKPKGPRFAAGMDIHKRSPLHLASAEGHIEIVRALLEENDEMCLVSDEDGRIPLHYATMRGHFEVIKQLISARNESIFMLLAQGETVLHLAVQYNHLEALKLLVESVGYDNNEFLNLKAFDGGNTILHLAVMLKQIETVKYLLSVPGVKAGAETLNQSGSTAFDMLQHFPKDFKSLKIQTIFMDINADDKKQKNQYYNPNLPPPIPPTDFVYDHQEPTKPEKRWWRDWIGYLEDNGDNWLEESRGSMMVVATVISTMTFQTATNPPGGVWQENVSSKMKHFDCSENNTCLAGTAVLARSVSDADFHLFITLNTISFIVSLSIILLLISGFPLKNKFCMWVLTIAMCITLTFMALTFLISLALVTPLNIAYAMLDLIKIWLGLLSIIFIFYLVRFVVWIVKNCRQGRRRFIKFKMTMDSRKDSSRSSSRGSSRTMPMDINKMNGIL